MLRWISSVACAALIAGAAAETPPPAEATTPSKAVGFTHDCSSYFPDEARRLWETGDVLVGYDVGVDGSLSNIHLVKGSGFQTLDDGALACVRERWRNTPALLNGVPVASPEHQAIVRFGIAEPVTAEDFYYRGVARDIRGDNTQALSDLTKAIALAPNAAVAYRARADVYDKLGQADLAKADLAKAVALSASPSNVQPSRVVGNTHNCSGYYPAASRSNNESGNVLIMYDVGADGAISNVRVVKSSGSTRLDDAALACVRERWRNTPATQDGVGIASPGHQAIIPFSAR